MTSTLDVVKAVLTKKWALEILNVLCEDNLTFTNLKIALRVQHNNQILRTVKILDKLALVDHVYTKSGDFYRLSARGKKILEIINSIDKNAPLEVIC